MHHSAWFNNLDLNSVEGSRRNVQAETIRRLIIIVKNGDAAPLTHAKPSVSALFRLPAFLDCSSLAAAIFEIRCILTEAIIIIGATFYRGALLPVVIEQLFHFGCFHIQVVIHADSL